MKTSSWIVWILYSQHSFSFHTCAKLRSDRKIQVEIELVVLDEIAVWLLKVWQEYGGIELPDASITFHIFWVIPDHVDEPNVCQKCLGTKSSNFKKTKLLLLKWNNDDSRNGIQGRNMGQIMTFFIVDYFLEWSIATFLCQSPRWRPQNVFNSRKAADFESFTSWIFALNTLSYL